MDYKNHFDYRDGELFWKYSPNANVPKGSKAGTLRKDGYKGIYLKGCHVFAHRIIYQMFVGELNKKDSIDHINGVRNDNRYENLRKCTHQENHRNRSKQSNNKSGFKGVSWHKQKKKWVAQIKYEGRNKFLGFFKCPTSAYFAYCKAAKSFYKEFARL